MYAGVDWKIVLSYSLVRYKVNRTKNQESRDKMGIEEKRIKKREKREEMVKLTKT
jgi:hypothetical protein